ncbi:MAG: hypothetical protein ACLQDL_16150 [Spirochaetia bacterium]
MGLVLIRVPQKKLITVGPNTVVRHPLYTSVALLVIPGIPRGIPRVPAQGPAPLAVRG